jgi:glycolate oxidase iron-sulfur subunit
VDVLLANGCEVVTPRMQHCCGSLHGHNGEVDTARDMARRNIDAMERTAGSLDNLDAIISNAGGCGSHLKHYGHLLHGDPKYAARAAQWSAKLKDVHEFLWAIGPVKPSGEGAAQVVTYHESCHLCHGQKVSAQPRQLLRVIPGLKLVELSEATWCCGSAGIYNLTQPEMAGQLLDRKMDHVIATKAQVVATGKPGCLLQLVTGCRSRGVDLRVAHPVTLLAEAYRR